LKAATLLNFHSEDVLLRVKSLSNRWRGSSYDQCIIHWSGLNEHRSYLNRDARMEWTTVVARRRRFVRSIDDNITLNCREMRALKLVPQTGGEAAD